MFQQRKHFVPKAVFLRVLFFNVIVLGYINASLGQNKHTEQVTCYPFPNLMWYAQLKNTYPNDNFQYIVQIAVDSNFRHIVDEDTVGSARYVPDKPLIAGEYFWRYAVLESDKYPTHWTQTSSFVVPSVDITLTVSHSSDSRMLADQVHETFQKAADFGRNGKVVQINFEKGDYSFAADTGYFIQLEDTYNIRINGNGSRLTLASYQLGFIRILRSSNILVEGFDIDFSPQKTFVFGNVSEVNRQNNSLVFTLHAESPTYDDTYVRAGVSGDSHACVLDRTIDGKLKDDAPNYFRFDHEASQKVGDRQFKMRIKNGIPEEIEKGDRVVDYVRTRGKPLCYVNGGQSVTFYNIRSLSAPSFHYAGYYSSEVNVIHCRALLPEGRWMGGNADGVHMRSLGIGPWIEGCEFSGLGDDGVALYARPMRAKSVPDHAYRLVVANIFFTLACGDKVAFFAPGEGKILLETSVVSVSAQADDWLVEFADPVPPWQSGKSIQWDNQIWNLSKSCGDFVIRRNVFDGIRRYGTVFRAIGGLVEDNYYRHTSSSAIISINEPIWPNGLYSKDIIIRNNVIENCGYEKGRPATIAFRFNRMGGLAQGIGSRDITIIENDIRNCAQVFKLQNTDRVYLLRNRVNGQLKPDLYKRFNDE